MADAEQMRRQIDALSTKGVHALQEQFTMFFGFKPGDTNVRNLRLRIACKLQEVYLGGLSQTDKIVLDSVANECEREFVKARGLVKPLAVKPGTRFTRVYCGREFVAVATEDGKFEYGGTRYNSLSAVALAVTGTKWNGRAFFKVSGRGQGDGE